MPKAVSVVRDQRYDEVSLVDRPANQYAPIVLAKRADAELEDHMPDDFVGSDGSPLDLSEYEPGQQFTDDEGNTFEWDGEDLYQLDDEDAGDRELAEVGKSAFFADPDGEVIARVSAELSKAVSDEDRNAVVSKAFTSLAKRAEAAEQRAARAEQIAKAEQDRRLTADYIAKAAEYNVPVDPSELGPVLMRMSGALSYEDCAVINKALTASGEAFTEIGVEHGGFDDDSPAAQLDAFLDERAGDIAKAGGTPISKAQAMTDYFDANPAAYDAMRAERIR